MLQRTVLTVILIGACAICLTLVVANQHTAKAEVSTALHADQTTAGDSPT